MKGGGGGGGWLQKKGKNCAKGKCRKKNPALQRKEEKGFQGWYKKCGSPAGCEKKRYSFPESPDQKVL